MALFYYKSIDPSGKKIKGMIDAASDGEAKEKLRNQGIILISFSEKEEKRSRLSQRNEHLRGSSLITFTTQLSQLLTAGMPLYESLISLEEQYRQEKFHRIILRLCDRIKEGASLSHAMEEFPKSFNPLYCGMVSAGESIGGLNDSLSKLATLLSKQIKLKKQLLTALLYPIVLCAFSLVVITLLMTFVIPSLEALFADRNVNRFTHLVMQSSHFLTRWWPLYIPLMIAFLGGSYSIFKTPKGNRWFHIILLKLPLVKTVLTQAALSRFCRTMGSLLQGGVTIIKALQISRNVVRNPLLEEAIEQAEISIVEGSLLSIELKKSKWIPALIPRMLSIGEEGGSTSVMLEKIADLYEEEVEKTLTRITALAQPLILLIMGGVVGVIMMAILLPLTDVRAFL